MKTFCAQAGCTGIAVDARYCPTHLKNNDEVTAAKVRRSSSTGGWYSLRIWRDRLRPMKLRRNPVCQDCNREVATEVHHLKKFSAGQPGAWTLFVDIDNNTISLCKACHSARTMKGE